MKEYQERETELVKKAKKGDTASFARLYEQVYREMYRFALYTLKNPQDAEDVVSETVLDAWIQIPNLRKAESFRAWIFRILSNKCRMKLKLYLQKTEELPEDLAAEEGDLSERMDVRMAFSRLQNEERLILSMNLFAGYTSREIGTFLGQSHNTIRSKQARALKKMETMLRRIDHG
ncbi:MAG: RNA polymerase sigma factor [Candidatus Limivivens sp.]|nr:RNA polymerase sigma factor [Candidatus Limivivens sp.]